MFLILPYILEKIKFCRVKKGIQKLYPTFAEQVEFSQDAGQVFGGIWAKIFLTRLLRI